MIKAKERPLESTSPQEKNSVAEPMKNVTVGECKPGKKKKKQSSKALENASLEKLQRKPGKKKTEFKSVGECKSGKKKKQSSKAQENVTVGILNKSDDGKDIIKKD